MGNAAQNLTATYGADGLRAKRTTPVQGTLYFLYDEAGAAQTPLIEETFISGTTAVASANGIGADGWRSRYYPAGSSGSNYWVYAYDPQGNAIQKQGQSYSSYNVYSVTSYDSYGNRSPEVYTTTGGVSPHRDPVGFGGQWGYYTEWETGPGNGVAGSSLLCLTHRYYDTATGRFVNRDPIGYDGGVNLYIFAGGNPINEIDPDGFGPPKGKKAPLRDPYPGNIAEKEALELLPDTLAAIDNANIKRYRIVQAIGNAPRSKGTHYADGQYKGQLYGCAVDISVKVWKGKKRTDDDLPIEQQNAMVRSLREQGFAAWRRDGVSFPDPHIHLIDPIGPKLRSDKEAQIQQFLERRNGLGTRAIDKKVPISSSEINAVKSRQSNHL